MQRGISLSTEAPHAYTSPGNTFKPYGRKGEAKAVRDRPPDAKQILAILYGYYQAAPNPKPKQKHSIWYRLKRLIWKLWTRWERIALADSHEHLDGTNNACERLIGWWIKERYRTMRGYKRTLSIRNVVALTSLLGAAVEPYDMGLLYA